MKKIISILGFFLLSLLLKAQKTDSLNNNITQRFYLGGYVKNMQTLYIIDSLNLIFKEKVLLDNLVHNRINFRWQLNKSLLFRAEIRNRIFLGQLMELSPDFGDRVDTDASNLLLNRKAWYSPSWLIVNRKDLVIHSMIDRLSLEYNYKKWEIRFGRQRINWGVCNAWNPYDIFNTYNFTDFDYEERPGTDALSLSYYKSELSKIQIAIQAFNAFENFNTAAIWQFNKKGYDFQLLGGLGYRHILSGIGWAGNIGNVGFKGESTFFYSLQDSIKNSLNSTLSADYIFSNSLYLNVALLYNSNGSNSTNLFGFKLSSSNLYPYPYNLMVMASYPINPLLTASMVMVYSPGKRQAVFISPNLSYSLGQNWDLDFVSQILCWKEKKYNSPIQMLFLRLKWSF